MKLTTPRTLIWLLSLALGVLGVLISLNFVTIHGLASQHAIWLVVAGLGLMLFATMYSKK